MMILLSLIEGVVTSANAVGIISRCFGGYGECHLLMQRILPGPAPRKPCVLGAPTRNGETSRSTPLAPGEASAHSPPSTASVRPPLTLQGPMINSRHGDGILQNRSRLMSR